MLTATNRFYPTMLCCIFSFTVHSSCFIAILKALETRNGRESCLSWYVYLRGGKCGLGRLLVRLFDQVSARWNSRNDVVHICADHLLYGRLPRTQDLGIQQRTRTPAVLSEEGKNRRRDLPLCHSVVSVVLCHDFMYFSLKNYRYTVYIYIFFFKWRQM